MKTRWDEVIKADPIKDLNRAIEAIYNQPKETIEGYRIERYLATGIDDRFLGYKEHPSKLIEEFINEA